MKYSIFAMTIAALAATTVYAQDDKKAPAAEAKKEVAEKPTHGFTTDDQKLGYAIGQDIGRNVSMYKDLIDVDVFFTSIKDAFEGKDSKMTQAEMSAVFMDLPKRMAAENKKKGEAFMAENKKKEGVKTTESGLQYEVIKAAEGAKPKATDSVTVHYTGTLLDGTVFDSSVERGEPTTFPLNGVIPGWTEGLQLMTVGSKYRFTIPSNLAYGERGTGRQIGPNSTLQFEVELIKINNP